MSVQDLPRPIAYTKQTFFNLLLAGYATGIAPESVARFDGDSGTKRNVWKDDADWLGIDEWRTTILGNGSNGTTSIYHNKVLIWEMQYGGSYPDRAIWFLKQALHQNYSQRTWRGGRGPERFSEGSFRYYNDIENDDFSWFTGTETIEELRDDRWQRIGVHHYRGGFLY